MTGRSVALTGLGLVAILIALGDVQATDWPQWRGPNRDGVSTETGLAETWPASGPPVLWSASPGVGFSSISIAGERLYTLGDGDGGQYLFCFDVRTGRELWRVALGSSFVSPYGDGPRSTPLVDESLVFAIGTDGVLFAVDRENGQAEWQRDLVGDLGAELPTYGFASSPLMVRNRLLVDIGGSKGAFVALAKNDGRVLWASQEDRSAYSSPIVVAIGETSQAVFWSGTGLHAISPETGELLWKFAAESLCPVTGVPLNTGTPLFVAPDRLYVADGSGARMLQIVKSENGWHVELLWETEQMRSDVSSAVLVGDSIYGFNRGILQSLDVKTGEIGWRSRGFSRGSLIAADGRLIVLGEEGNLAMLDAGATAYVEPASAEVLDDRSWTAPSLANGRLYLRNHGQLVALDLARERVWNESDEPTGGAP